MSLDTVTNDVLLIIFDIALILVTLSLARLWNDQVLRQLLRLIGVVKEINTSELHTFAHLRNRFDELDVRLEKLEPKTPEWFDGSDEMKVGETGVVATKFQDLKPTPQQEVDWYKEVHPNEY